MRTRILLTAVLLIPLACEVRAQRINIDALKSDDKRFNAVHEQAKIWDVILHAAAQPPVRALEKAISSKDYQQRQMAADLLRNIEGYRATRRLLEVTVEGLADDRYPWDPNAYPNAKDENDSGAYVFVFNAADGVRYLVDHGHAAKYFLLNGLKSDCPQKRFLCAYVLGVNGIRHDLERTVDILIYHLRDNDIPSDACMSAAALYRLGMQALPQLKEALKTTNDKQQRELLSLIIDDLLTPPKTRKELEHRKKRHSVTQLVFDPAIESDQMNYYIWFPYGKKNIKDALEGKMRVAADEK